jgi:GDP-L-fucose synthase
MVGSSVVRMLTELGFNNLLTPRKAELDLRDTEAVKLYFTKHKPVRIVLSSENNNTTYTYINSNYKYNGVYCRVTMHGNNNAFETPVIFNVRLIVKVDSDDK